MKKSFVLVILTALVTSGCSQKGEIGSGGPYERGLALVDKREFARADTLFGALAAADSTAMIGLYGRGLTQERQLLYPDALKYYFAALARNPNYGPALLGGIRVFDRMGEPFDAALMAVSAVKALPNDREAQLLAARALIEAGNYPEADGALNTASVLGSPLEEIDLTRAYLLFRSGMIDQAEGVAAKHLSGPLKTPGGLRSAADYLEERGWIDSAMAFSRQSVVDGNNGFDLLMVHFLRCLRTHYFVDARRLIDSLRPLDKEQLLTETLDQHFFWAADSIRQALTATLEFQKPQQMTLSTIYYDIRSRFFAKDYFAVFQDIQDLVAWSLKTNTSQELQNFLDYRTGVIASRLMDKMTGYAKLKEITGWRQNLPDAKTGLAMTMLTTGRNDEWTSLRDSIMKFRGDQPDWLMAMASCYTDMQVAKPDEAEKLYRKVLELSPTSRPAFDSLYQLFTTHRKYDKALKLFETYQFFSDHFPKVRIDKAISLIQSGKVDQGLSLFESNMPFLRGDLAQFDRAAVALDDVGASDSKGKLVDLMNQLNPSSSQSVIRTARFENDRGNFQQTLDLCEKQLALKPQTDFMSQKARALYGLHRANEALALFDEVETRDDGSWDAVMEHARVLALEKKNLIQAENLARFAVGRDGSSMRSQLALIDVYLLLGRGDLARGEALKATLNYPEAPQAYYYRGMVLAREKNPEARENLQKGIALGLRGPNLAAAQELLKKI